jgi:DNA replication protein
MTYYDYVKEGQTVIPNSLLRHYTDLFEQPIDFVVWLTFYQNAALAPSEVAAQIKTDLDVVTASINRMNASGTMRVATIFDGVDVDTDINPFSIFERLEDLMGMSKTEVSRPQAQAQPVSPAISSLPAAPFNSDIELQGLYEAFEGEMGPLSPMKMEEIREFVERDKYEPAMIRLALKEAAIKGITDLRYIAKILSNWRAEGTNSANDVERKQQNRTQVQPQKDFTLNLDQWIKKD